jgi:hypothetical protein
VPGVSDPGKTRRRPGASFSRMNRRSRRVELTSRQGV